MVIFILACLWVWEQWPDSKLKLIFCDVGQGDGALIVLGSFQAVVDTGAYENKIVECLAGHMPFWDREIEIVFLSHSDKDHSGALPGIKKRYHVGKIIDKPHYGDVVRYGNLSFDILKGSEVIIEGGGKEEASNDLSVVMRMEYGRFTALFTGDIDIETELALVDRGVLKSSDVLKVSHHGSKYGSAKEFLEKLKPKLAMISVGSKNNYGHPHSDTLLRLEAVGAKILRTDKMGTIKILSDGETLEVYSDK